MGSPFLVYFAGVGSVVAALAVGFGGGWVLSSAEPAKDRPASQAAARRETPPLSTTPVTVRTPEENAAKSAAEPAADPQPPEIRSTEARSVETDGRATDGRAVPGANWVAKPPPADAGTAATSAPVAPLTAPLDPPSVVNAPPAAAPPAAVTVRRGPHAEERVIVDRERATDGRGDSRANEMRPQPAGETLRDRAKAERRTKDAERLRAEQRRSARQKVEEADASDDDDDAPEVAPQPLPPMRDAGALRGF